MQTNSRVSATEPANPSARIKVRGIFYNPDINDQYPMSDQPPTSNTSSNKQPSVQSADKPSRPSRRKRSKLPADAPDVVSPCISICEIDQSSGVCKGCYRTLEEIATWSRMDNQQRWDIVQSLRDRRRAID